MTRATRTPARRGGVAEAIRHQLVALSTSLGRLVDDFGTKADSVKYGTFQRGMEQIAERIAQAEAKPIRNPERLHLGGAISDPRKRTFQ